MSISMTYLDLGFRPLTRILKLGNMRLKKIGFVRHETTVEIAQMPFQVSDMFICRNIKIALRVPTNIDGP